MAVSTENDVTSSVLVLLQLVVHIMIIFNLPHGTITAGLEAKLLHQFFYHFNYISVQKVSEIYRLNRRHCNSLKIWDWGEILPSVVTSSVVASSSDFFCFQFWSLFLYHCWSGWGYTGDQRHQSKVLCLENTVSWGL